MRRRITPSPALVVAIVALVVAMAGSAVAAGTLITSRNIKNGTIQLVDLSAKAKKALKGARGPQGQQGIPGPAGPAGPAGPQGQAGTARAYAIYDASTGRLQKARGVTAVRSPMTGIYCLTVPGIDPASTVAAAGQTTIGARYSDGHVSTDWFQCNNDEFQVATMSDESNQLTSAIDFWFLVP